MDPIILVKKETGAKLSEKEDGGIKERKGIRRRWWVCFMEMVTMFFALCFHMLPIIVHLAGPLFAFPKDR